MRTNILPYLAIVFAIVGLMFAGSGINDVFGTERSSESLSSQMSEQANSSSVGEGNFSEDASTDTSSGSIVGFIVGGLRGISDFVGLVVGLPQAIRGLGFPAYFAWPVGRGIQLIASIGVIQFASNRYLR